MVERYVRDVEVACSNHVTPIFCWDTTEFVIADFVVFFSFHKKRQEFSCLCSYLLFI